MKIYAPNMLCRWESSYIISQKSCENPMFLRFFSKKSIFANFHVYFQYIKICEGTLTLGHHSDVYEVQWYSFWYQWIEEVHTYTLVANIGVSSILYRKSREGIATIPHSENVLQKYLRRTRVKIQHSVEKNSAGVVNFKEQHFSHSTVCPRKTKGFCVTHNA